MCELTEGTVVEKKCAIISGASRGIGEAISRKLAQDGYRVCLLARNENDLNALCASISESGGDAVAFAVDLSNAEELNEKFARIGSTLGTVDLLVCNAGAGKFQPIMELELADWDLQMNLNARASFVLSRLVVPLMVQRKKGHLVFITSDAARRTFSNGVAYCASKFAQHAMAAALRQELRPSNVKVTEILPGLVASYFNNSTPDSQEKSDWLKPADVADAVSYAVAAPPNVIVDEIMLHPMSQSW